MSLAALVVFTLALTLVGVRLAGVKVYPSEARAAHEQPLLSFLVDLTYVQKARLRGAARRGGR